MKKGGKTKNGDELLMKYSESVSAFWVKADYGEMLVKRSHSVHLQTPHYRKANAINDGKILVLARRDRDPCNFQVCQTDSFDRRYPAPKTISKSLCSPSLKSVVKQSPGLDYDPM